MCVSNYPYYAVYRLERSIMIDELATCRRCQSVARCTHTHAYLSSTIKLLARQTGVTPNRQRGKQCTNEQMNDTIPSPERPEDQLVRM